MEEEIYMVIIVLKINIYGFLVSFGFVFLNFYCCYLFDNQSDVSSSVQLFKEKTNILDWKIMYFKAQTVFNSSQ